MKRTLSMMLGTLLLFAASAFSDNMSDAVKKLAGDAAQAYVGPVVSSFGADMNGGWYHRAPSAKMLGFDLEFGIVGMYTPFPSGKKTFSTSGNFRYDSTYASQLTGFMRNDPRRATVTNAIASQDLPVGMSGPTIVGAEGDSIRISFGGTVFKYGPNATDTISVPAKDVYLPIGGALGALSGLPLGMPQLSIGTVAGTKLTFRYLPKISSSAQIPKVSLFGWGIQHNPGMWLPTPLPVDVSLSFFTQDLKLGDLVDAKSTSFGVNVSKQFGPGMLNVTPYAGFNIESSKMTFTYEYTFTDPAGNVTTQQLNFELKGENKTRLLLGLSFGLGPFNINADYNIGTYSNFTGGFMFSF